MRFDDYYNLVRDMVVIPDYVFFQAMGRTQSSLNLIHRWRVEGKIIRLKRGLYILSERYRKKTPCLHFQIANILVSPSYVSLDTALSYHGMIPEKIVETTSVCMGRPKTLSNALGMFSYRKIKGTAYPHGVASEGEGGQFLIAGREKALLDKIYFFHSERSFKMGYLFDSLRIEEGDIRELDFDLLDQYSEFYRTKKMALVAKIIRRHYGV